MLTRISDSSVAFLSFKTKYRPYTFSTEILFELIKGFTHETMALITNKGPQIYRI